MQGILNFCKVYVTMSERGIVRSSGASGADGGLSVSGPARAVHEPLEFDEVQRRIIRDSFANGASDQEFAVLLEVARARRLNPLLRQIHFVQRWDSDKGRSVWAAQVSIDGLRAIAERTGLYAGQDEPEFVELPDGTLKLCKVRVWRKDWPRPAVGVAYWAEYVQSIRDRATGKFRPAAMWGRMPHTMLAKCAESLALRKAFPEDMAGLYTTEEMGQAANESPAVQHRREEAARVTAAPVAPTVRTVERAQAGPVKTAEMRRVEATPAVVTASTVVEVARVEVAKVETIVVEAGPGGVVQSSRDPWMDYLG